MKVSVPMTRSFMAVLFAVFTLSALNGAGRRFADDGLMQAPRLFGAYNTWGQQDSSAKLAEIRHQTDVLRKLAGNVGLSDDDRARIETQLQAGLSSYANMTEDQAITQFRASLVRDQARLKTFIESDDEAITAEHRQAARQELAEITYRLGLVDVAGSAQRAEFLNYEKQRIAQELEQCRAQLMTGISDKERKTVKDQIGKLQTRYDAILNSDDQSPYLSALAHLFIKDLGPNFRLPADAGIQTVIGMGLMATTVKPAIEQLTEVSRNVSAEMRSWMEKRFAALLRWFKIGNSFTMKDTTRWSQTVKTVIDTLKVAAKAMTSASATKHALGARDIKALQGAAETQETKQEFLLGAANIRKLKRLRDEVMVKKAFYLSEESRRHKLAQDTLILVNYFDDAIENLGLLMTLIHGANGVEGLSDAVCAAEIEGIGEATISTFGDLRALIDPNAEAATTAKSSYGYSGYGGQSAAYAGQYSTATY